MHRAHRRRQGFTLVEVLVALVIMAVIAAMGWQGVAGMSRAREIGGAASDRTLRLQAVVGQWETDLSQVYDSPPALQMPGLGFDGSSLRLLRRSEGGVQVVVWSLREGVWRRWAGPVARSQSDLAQAWAVSSALQGTEAGQLQLFDGIKGWQVYFWRGQGWSNAQSSGDIEVSAQVKPPSPPASGASAPDQGASAPAAPVSRTLLPSGVRLQLDMPEGVLLRDVQLGPQQP